MVHDGDGLINNGDKLSSKYLIWSSRESSFSYIFKIFVFIPEESSRLHLFSAVFLAERFFNKAQPLFSRHEFGDGNNNEHLGAAFKLERGLQALCFISQRSRMIL